MNLRAAITLGAALALLAGACGGNSNQNSSGNSGGGGSGNDGGSGGSGGNGNTGGSGGSGGSGGGHAAICPGGPYASTPLPANATAKKIQGGFHFLEGPVWIADQGFLLFSDMNFSVPNPPPLNGPVSNIMRFTPPSTFDVFIESASSNGLALDDSGGILACTHDTRSVSRYDVATKKRSVVVDAYMGKHFNSPNDVARRSDGNIYFSDPDWQLSAGTPSELPMAAYRVAPNGDVSVIEQLDKPNGVTLSPDEAMLYVGAVDNKIRRYALDAAGAPGPAQDFATVNGPDGMTVDCAGNLYVTGSAGVTVLSPKGDTLGTVAGTGTATNVAFGGPERKTLFITAGDSLYAIDLAIPGYPY
jgi:gluconolactonase